MKKAFTLIELMVVVAIIAILLSITYRLGKLGGEDERRAKTLLRMNCIENALSGYYAAFGSYPPVELCASRNVYTKYNKEQSRQEEGQETDSLDKDAVRAACEAQPFAARFPFPDDPEVQAYIEQQVEEVRLRVQEGIGSWSGYSDLAAGFAKANKPNDFENWTGEQNWKNIKVFQFGVMSFLMPRYLFMANAYKDESMRGYLDSCAQWKASNKLASHPNSGAKFGSFKDQLTDQRLVLRIPSQSVCARWIPNFENMVTMNELSCPGEMFGIRLKPPEALNALQVNDDTDPEVFVRNFDRPRKKVMDCLTIRDGYDNDFYYYSPPPFQSYRLWSSGRDGLTFPPWVPFETLKSDADRKKAAEWMQDDIMYQSN